MAKAVGGVVLSDRIFLEEWDPDKDTYVVFQRPRRYEAEALAQLQARAERVYNTGQTGQVVVRESVPMALVETAQVKLCLVESNLPWGEDAPGEEGSLVFIPGKSCRVARKGLTERVEQGFEEAWSALDDDVCEEIIKKLQEWHPPFNWWAPSEGEA